MKIILLPMLVLATIVTTIYFWHLKNADSTIKIPQDDIRIISLPTLPSQTNKLIGKERVIRTNEADAVPEIVAQSLITQLKKWQSKDPKLVSSLYECSAIVASNLKHNNSSCFDDYTGELDASCLVAKGYGKKSVGQTLMADRVDLNNDGINDYIMSDRYYCEGLSANQSNVYFVMLSKAKNDFQLAYADWASYGLNVAVDEKNRSKILIESASKTYGTFTRIMGLVNGRYVVRSCIFQDEHGYSQC